MIELLVVIILCATCIAVIGMIICATEVADFARKMFERILNGYDRKYKNV